LKLSKKYKPLFKLLVGDNPQVDTIIVTGGRLSGKSFAVSTFATEGVLQYDYDILYARFTNISIEDSIKKEFVEKIHSLKISKYFDIQQSKAIPITGKGGISFKGIKTGMKGQTANLKSLVGFNCLIVDEAEEIPDKDTFKRIFYSIRSKERRNLSLLLLNPSTKEHWIYKEFFLDMGVEGGFNGVKGNVMYIHTSYLDLDKDVIPQNIYLDYERLKAKDQNEYEHMILGGWIDKVEGMLFPKNELQWFNLEEFVMPTDMGNTLKLSYIDVATGGMDYLCMVYGIIVNQKIYIMDVIMDNRDTAYTIPACRNMLHNKQPNYCIVESNGAGAVFQIELSRGAPLKTAIVPKHNSTNKETRIISNAYFIKEKMVFRNDYEVGDEYHEFIRQITTFNKNKSLNKNDDAPDALSGLATLAQEECHRLLY
jgi:PBSX family phage terminase large subunit